MLKISDGKLLIPGSKKSLLSNIQFESTPGLLTLIQGKNGSGKTSFLKGLIGLDFSITNYQKLYNEFYYLPQIENKDFLLPITLNDIAKEKLLLNDEELKTSWQKASGGQRKKALLTNALNSPSEILFLDEPFNHLDQESIQISLGKIKRLLEKKKTIILVSHNTQDFESLPTQKIDIEKWK